MRGWYQLERSLRELSGMKEMWLLKYTQNIKSYWALYLGFCILLFVNYASVITEKTIFPYSWGKKDKSSNPTVKTLFGSFSRQAVENLFMTVMLNWKSEQFIIIYDIELLWCSSVQFSRSVVFNSLQPHGLQHIRPPCPSPTPRVYSNSCPLSQWCHPTISSFVMPFSSRLQSFPALFKWVSSSHQVVVKVLEFQLQHQSF